MTYLMNLDLAQSARLQKRVLVDESSQQNPAVLNQLFADVGDARFYERPCRYTIQAGGLDQVSWAKCFNFRLADVRSDVYAFGERGFSR